MKNLRTMICITLAAVLAVTSLAGAQELKTINLPEPEKTGGLPFMETLMNRSSTREYSTEKLPAHELSNILWAAWGFNRPEKKLRTAPSASNRQELTVYAILEEGVFRYDAEANTLVQTVSGDIRESSGQQDFVYTAPLNLVFVADLTKMGGNNLENKIRMALADTGYISQNVYLYCASRGLGTVVRGLFDREVLSKAMKLGPDQYITLTQTVGYMK
ncbi:SagB/ThcOx family dehydrogenase [Candidatus Latescibacterota bacterium]